jgi:hypothetical protein
MTGIHNGHNSHLVWLHNSAGCALSRPSATVTPSASRPFARWPASWKTSTPPRAYLSLRPGSPMQGTPRLGCPDQPAQATPALTCHHLMIMVVRLALGLRFDIALGGTLEDSGQGRDGWLGAAKVGNGGGPLEFRPRCAGRSGGIPPCMAAAQPSGLGAGTQQRPGGSHPGRR